MTYADGFVLPISKSNMRAYTAMARKGARIWREHGAVDYRECVLQDARAPGVLAFPRGVRVKRGETVVLAWILYRSRAHRDSVNKKVMKDPRLPAMMKGKKMPFDVKRMMYGGFVEIAR